MRMWAIDPRQMCRQHLLGEHVEMHMFTGTRTARIMHFAGYGYVSIHHIDARHDMLAFEMARRGYDHQSPIDSPHRFAAGFRTPWRDTVELAARCPNCLPDLQPYLNGHQHAVNIWPDPDLTVFWTAVDDHLRS